MSQIYYYHYHPSRITGEREILTSDTPIPYDFDKSGCFSDCIYHSRNSGARFYIVVFGYEKGWYHEPNVIKNNRYILHFILDGKGTFNGEPVERGDICVALPNRKYSIGHSESAPMTFGWISLSGKELELLIDMLHLPKSHTMKLNEGQIKRLNELFWDAVYQLHPEEELPFFLFSRFFQTLSIAKIPYASIYETNNPHIDHALRFINTHYAKDITVYDIAREVNLSVSHLRTLFTQELQYSPYQAIINKRMAVAMALLKAKGEISMNAVAEQCGYMDQGAFAKRFKKHTGQSPTEYRKHQINGDTEKSFTGE